MLLALSLFPSKASGYSLLCKAPLQLARARYGALKAFCSFLIVLAALYGQGAVAQGGCSHYELDEFVAKGFDTRYGLCLRALLQLDAGQTAEIELEMLNAVSQLEKTAHDSLGGQLNTILWSRAQAHEIISRVLTPRQFIVYLRDRIQSQIPPLASGEEYKKPRYYMVRKLLGHSIDMRAYKAVPLSNLQRQNIVRLLRPHYREKRDLEKNRKLDFNRLLYYRVRGAQALDASLSDDQKSLYSLYNRFGFDLFDHGYVATTTPIDDDDGDELTEPGPAAATVKAKLIPPKAGAAGERVAADASADQSRGSKSKAVRSGAGGAEDAEGFSSSLDDLAFLEQVLEDFCLSDSSDMDGVSRALEHRFSFEGAVLTSLADSDAASPAQCSDISQGAYRASAFGRVGGYVSLLLLLSLIACSAALYREKSDKKSREKNTAA